MQKYTVIVDSDNCVFWYKEGTDMYHRENGPAIEYPSGYKVWYQNGKLHRLDGPAKECSDGRRGWYIEGREYTEAEFKQYTTKDTYDGKEVVIDGKIYKLTRATQD